MSYLYDLFTVLKCTNSQSFDWLTRVHLLMSLSNINLEYLYIIACKQLFFSKRIEYIFCIKYTFFKKVQSDRSQNDDTRTLLLTESSSASPDRRKTVMRPKFTSFPGLMTEVNVWVFKVNNIMIFGVVIWCYWPLKKGWQVHHAIQFTPPKRHGWVYLPI